LPRLFALGESKILFTRPESRGGYDWGRPQFALPSFHFFPKARLRRFTMRTPLMLLAAFAISGFALGAQARSDGDPRGFIEDAIRGDSDEMMLGKLAADRATDPKVRDYGRMVYEDHARAKEQAVAVAHQVGADAAERADVGAERERATLEETSGRPFDREFLRYMINDHRKDIAEFSDEAQRGGPAGQLAADTLPELKKHLSVAEQLSTE
jgi:putative membrane protein